MSRLSTHVQDYLALRRSLGFALEGIDRLLLDFVAHLEDGGLDTVTTQAALAWATRPAGAHPSWHAKRLGYVRRFAAYLHTFDPDCEVPAHDLLPSRPTRHRPYLYSDDDIAALMAQARRLTPQLRAATYETVIGLLAITGMRPGEVLRLDRCHVDLDTALVHVFDSKFHDSRQLPLHPSTVQALVAYVRLRDQLCPDPAGPAFFVSAAGTRLRHGVLNHTFARLRQQAGLHPSPVPEQASPRPHDFRHTFAVRTMLGWYRAEADVDANLPALSTYLGHADPAGTYWYLSSTPELLAHAARRLGWDDKVGR